MKFKRRWAMLISGAFVLGVVAPNPSQAAIAPAIDSVEATYFTGRVHIEGIDPATFRFARFLIETKDGGLAMPVQATFSREYLTSRGYYAGQTDLTVPVFGLYQGRTNRVHIDVINHHTLQEFSEVLTRTSLDKMKTQESRTVHLTTDITTQAWVDGRYLNPNKYQARSNSVALNYSYMMLKNWDVGYSPTMMDTDGELRWVGEVPGYGPSQASLFHDNGVYFGSGQTLLRMELDGTAVPLKNYYESDHVTYIGHHNYDLGKNGILLEVDRTTDVESAIIEVDFAGNVLKTFDFNQIIEDAIREGGEDPSGFVRRDSDWFHNNSATYWRAQDTLVVSSRENFVIGVDYETQKIKWIFGDVTKYWYSFKSLRKYALSYLTPNTEPPIGQHAVSITAQGELMLFDNGTQSFNQPTMGGLSRGYAAPRRYTIDLEKRMATMTWSFEHDQNIYSPICSSIYQDGDSYLIDYASVNWGQTIRLIGLGRGDRVAFDYELPGGWGNGWNSQPIHLENLKFL